MGVLEGGQEFATLGPLLPWAESPHAGPGCWGHVRGSGNFLRQPRATPVTALSGVLPPGPAVL